MLTTSLLRVSSGLQCRFVENNFSVWFSKKTYQNALTLSERDLKNDYEQISNFLTKFL